MLWPALCSSASFGTATGPNGELLTAGDTLPSVTFPESRSTEALRGPHHISAATKARQYLQKCISILSPADMLWLLLSI